MAMSRTSKTFLLIVTPAAISALAILGVVLRLPLVSFSQTQSQTSGVAQSVRRLSQYRIPDSLDFCGERVPLEIPDVRERMEQAFYTEFSDPQIILDLKRSTEYFPFIEQRLRDMNLPSDLKYLAVAESALRNLVSSRSAAGIWQFTDDNARRYGLIVDVYFDERFNFHKETQAALKCLSDLYSTFGSWSLAAAGYNMGGGGVKASLDYQMVRNYYSLYLNDETSRFVFRIVALKQIMSHYQMYGFELTQSDFYQPPETKLVVVTQIPDLATWARQQGSSYKEVKYLNPWLINRSLPPGTWAIELPKYAQRVLFTSPAPVIDSTLENSGSERQGKASTTYIVKPGDTLERVAAIYGVSVRDLARWNDLKDRNHLRAGEKLKIMIESPEPNQ